MNFQRSCPGRSTSGHEARYDEPVLLRAQREHPIMAMNMAGSSGGGGRRGRRRAVMAEINVTPMVDVMLVLLIIFMVSAPLLTVGVPLDLPQTQAKSLDQDKNPLTL